MPDIEEVDKKFVFDMPVLPDNVFLLRVTVLRDATLLSFGISHRLADATAQHQVIKAFCDLLSGNSIPELILPPDARGTNMSELVIPDTKASDIPSVDYKTHQDNFMGGFFPLVKLVLKTLWTEVLRMIGLRERLEGKFVYLPGPWVNGVRNAALETLKTQIQPKQHDGVEPTKNDIITTWLLKTIHDRVQRSDDPVDFYGPLNYRSAIPPPPAGTTWIHDSVGPLRHQLTVAQIQTESIATFARGLRLTTLRYKQASSIREYLRFCEDHVTETLIPRVRKPSWNLPLTVVSSWTTLDFAALDFSGAAPEKKEAKVIFVNPIARGMRSGFWPSAFTIKDKDGGYWVRAYMTPSAWQHLYHRSH
ncbi:hypothetical protein VTN00DRAFT_6143 [Thermoascus crustaceus]|uniref:uncharacterized protein n=1 Tax=Thermoascus crustaceus TaxID=5088 RepID=UPI0037444693